MKSRIIPMLLLALVAGAPLAAQGRPALDLVLSRWIRAYEKGQIELAELAVKKGKVDPLYGRGWLPGGKGVDLTHRAGLTALLVKAAERPQVEDAMQILRLAAIGLLDGRATLDRPHFAVRNLANLALPRLQSTDCVYLLMQAAGGDFRKWSRRPRDPAGMRAAAIFALGKIGLPVVRPTLQRQLVAEEQVVRLAAAEALRDMKHPRAIDDLAAAMRTERDPIVAQALVQSVHGILARHGEAIDARRRQVIVQSALVLLRRTDWRADLEIVELFAQLRSAAVIDRLIDILADDEAARAKGSRLAPRLVRTTLDTLRSLTGAIVPDEAARWREYWGQVQADFVVRPASKLAPTRTTAGFFGLPVVGSNVVFVIDTSGSMKAGFFPVGKFDASKVEDGQTRLSVAKRELLQAVDGLESDARFNLVQFASTARPWRKDLVRRTRRVRGELQRELERMRPAGGTNIFGALEQALEIRSLKYGARYEAPVDELFLLSDGEPTVGEVTDQATILQLIRETNRYSKVKINTIYMGGGGDSAFMKQLAEENGGSYLRL